MEEEYFNRILWWNVVRKSVARARRIVCKWDFDLEADPWCIAAGCSPETIDNTINKERYGLYEAGHFSLLPSTICTRALAGFAFDGAQVYCPESCSIAFWTNNRLVVRAPFSVTKEIPPLGESKFITCYHKEKLIENKFIFTK